MVRCDVFATVMGEKVPSCSRPELLPMPHTREALLPPASSIRLLHRLSQGCAIADKTTEIELHGHAYLGPGRICEPPEPIEDSGVALIDKGDKLTSRKRSDGFP